jgi:hypothetical protein
MNKWVLPSILKFYHENNIVDNVNYPANNFVDNLGCITAEQIRSLKSEGRKILNEVLSSRPDQNGVFLHFNDDEFVFDFQSA